MQGPLLNSLKPGSDDWMLVQSLDAARVPAHIGIIMDGNGRWANRRSLPRVAGHKAGVEPVRTSVETCAQLGVECPDTVCLFGGELETAACGSGLTLAAAELLPEKGSFAPDGQQHPVARPSAGWRRFPVACARSWTKPFRRRRRIPAWC